MPRAGRTVPLVALGAALLLFAGGGSAGAGTPEPSDQYWLGPYFGGLRLTYSDRSPGLGTEDSDTSFGYGDCEPPPDEGGCSIPAQVQNSSSCARNPLAIDRLPYRVYLVRGGGLAAEYERSGVDIGTGDRTITLYTEFELMGAALREVRPQTDTEPQPLVPPVYPMPVLRELKRVTVRADRGEGIETIARETGLRDYEVEFRLQVAELLGPDALANVPPPKMSIATVERLRQLAFRTQFNLDRGARRLGISKAELRKKIDRVRGLTGVC
jgi:hypothetical protein